MVRLIVVMDCFPNTSFATCLPCFTVLRFTVFTVVAVFKKYKLKATPCTSEKITTHFIAILYCGGLHPTTISVRHTWVERMDYWVARWQNQTRVMHPGGFICGLGFAVLLNFQIPSALGMGIKRKLPSSREEMESAGSFYSLCAKNNNEKTPCTHHPV